MKTIKLFITFLISIISISSYAYTPVYHPIYIPVSGGHMSNKEGFALFIGLYLILIIWFIVRVIIYFIKKDELQTKWFDYCIWDRNDEYIGSNIISSLFIIITGILLFLFVVNIIIKLL